MQTKNVVIGIAVFLLGVGVGGSGKTQTVTKEVPTEKIVEKTIEVEKNATEWRQLKTIDDRGFVVAGEQMTLCSQGFNAITNLDVKEMNRVATEIKTRTEILNGLATQRSEVLGKLGY